MATAADNENFFVRIFNHFRLTWRLLFDKRISIWLKAALIVLPIGYIVVPFSFLPIPDDLLCVVGLMDDLLLFSVATVIFNSMCPRAITHEHEMTLRGHHIAPEMTKLETYRNRDENRDLALGFLSALGLLLLGGYLGGIMLLLIFGVGYIATSLSRGGILANAVQTNENNLPHLYKLLQQAQKELPPAKVSLFVTQNPVMNAYTFGYHEPYTIVLNSGLVEKLSEPEIQSVIGHELGHILFGHTSIMSLIGTQGGLGALLFYKWSRSCEYSADAVAMLASEGDITPVVSSLLKLTSGLSVAVDLQTFLEQIKKGSSDDLASEFAQLLSSHPLMNNRIRNLIRLAQSLRSIKGTGAG